MQINPETTEALLRSGAIIIIALVSRIVAGIIIKRIVQSIEDDNPEEDTAIEKRTYTLASISKNAVNIFIIIITVLTLLSQWGIDITPFLTGAGILGLAVGFGTQTLVKDVVTGFFMLFENTYNVGDNVEIAGKQGKVIKMNLRTTMLIDEERNVYTVPNSNIGVVKKVKKNN